MTFDPNRLTVPNTAGGQYPGTISPAACTHGMAWALPCAACGRPYQPAPVVYQVLPDPTLHAKLDRILALLAILSGAAPEPREPVPFDT